MRCNPCGIPAAGKANVIWAFFTIPLACSHLISLWQFQHQRRIKKKKKIQHMAAFTLSINAVINCVYKLWMQFWSNFQIICLWTISCFFWHCRTLIRTGCNSCCLSLNNLCNAYVPGKHCRPWLSSENVRMLSITIFAIGKNHRHPSEI